MKKQDQNLSYINDILRTSSYHLDQFSAMSVEKLNDEIEQDNNHKYFVQCKVRKRKIQAKPEEVIRQLMIDKLITEYHYPVDLLRVEHPVKFGRETKICRYCYS